MLVRGIGSSAGYNAALNHIRKVMLSRDYTLEPSMQGLRIALRLAFLVVFIMALVGFVVVRDSLATMNRSINDVSAAAETKDIIAGFRKASTNMMMMARGFTSTDNEDAERRNLLYLMKNLTVVQDKLFLHRGAVPGLLRDIYSTPNIDLESIVGTTVSIRQENLWHTLAAIMTSADSIRQLPLETLSVDTHADNFVSPDHLASVR